MLSLQVGSIPTRFSWSYCFLFDTAVHLLFFFASMTITLGITLFLSPKSYADIFTLNCFCKIAATRYSMSFFCLLCSAVVSLIWRMHSHSIGHKTGVYSTFSGDLFKNLNISFMCEKTILGTALIFKTLRRTFAM